jgi:hypothetical protein
VKYARENSPWFKPKDRSTIIRQNTSKVKGAWKTSVPGIHMEELFLYNFLSLITFGRVGISDSILIYNFSHPRV